MKKVEYRDIFKDGVNFKFTKVDYSDPKIVAGIIRTRKEQQKTLDQLKVNLRSLEKFTFDI